jgi:hypothetical protein
VPDPLYILGGRGNRMVLSLPRTPAYR